MRRILAFDYGASNGRGILGEFDGDVLAVSEIHRFSNDPVYINGSFHWDILRLFHEMKQGIASCCKKGLKGINSIGTDTWGVDFGLLGASGELLGNPYHYRDKRTENMIAAACSMVPAREIYDQTGISFEKFNTLYQLLSMKLNDSPLLEKADTLLFIPDLLNYFLTGEKVSEFTIASVSQMYNCTEKTWAIDLIEKLGLPANILTDVINPGTIIGRTGRNLSDELGIPLIPVIAVAEHDTASAVVSVPAISKKYAYISSGTWSVIGTELPAQVIDDKTFSLNYTNEGGFNNTSRLLKNVMGLWVLQECKKEWDFSGDVVGYDELLRMAYLEKPFESLIDPDSDIFYSPGNMPEKIAEFCRNTGQKVPEGKGAVVRCIMESLALKYRFVINGLEEILGYKIPVLHVVGGGSRNVMLNQFTANAAGIPVIAGPSEGTATGNLICQLIALGDVADIDEGRALVRRSFETREYLPEDINEWEEAYGKFLRIPKQALRRTHE